MRWLVCIDAANGGKWSVDQELCRARFARSLLAAPDLVAVGGTLVGRRERPFDLLEDDLLALFGPLRT